METKNEEHPLKIRSAKGVIAAGYRLYMNNFRRIFRTTWLPALVCALVSALYYHTMISATTKLVGAIDQMAKGQYGEGMMQYVMQSGVSLLNLIVSLVFISYAFYMLSRHRSEGAIPYPARWLSKPDGRSLVRTVASAILWIVVVTIALVIPSAIIAFGAVRQSITTMALGLLVLLVLIALLLPLVYPNMRYLCTRDTKLFNLLGPGYRQGFRYWGYIFAVLLVVFLITCVILAVTMLPAMVLLIANMRAQAGVMTGDPLGMPSYMGWLSLIVFTLSGFIQAYVVLSMQFPVYYMAGSIEQQEIQRNEKAENTIH